MNALKTGGLFVALLIVVGVGGMRWWNHRVEDKPRSAEQIANEVRQRLNAWLNDQKGGGDGQNFWLPENGTFKKFFAFRKGIITKVEITNSNNEEACAQVLIESSNKGGELVSAIWTVTLVYKDQLKYDKVEKNWWITGQAKTSPTTYTGDD